MTRAFSEWVKTDEKTQKHLDELLRAVGEPARYREAMHTLGRDLGREVDRHLPAKGEVIVVCTVEDADFLTRGLLEEIETPSRRAALVCFWNERKHIGKQEVAPIIARYEEPIVANKVTALIVLKSIISGSCVVRTNLTEMLDRFKRAVPIYVVAPVLHDDAMTKLEREFSAAVVKRMTPIWCARDSDREADGTVVPGIGGTVYELLGLGTEEQKNRVRPRILTSRLTRLAATS